MLDHLIGDYDTAENWFTEALALHERVRSPVLVAQTNYACAALLADRGRDDDHERAHQMASAALDAATAGGYGYVEADARAVLNASANRNNAPNARPSFRAATAHHGDPKSENNRQGSADCPFR
jgi:hypothetical protein